MFSSLIYRPTLVQFKLLSWRNTRFQSLSLKRKFSQTSHANNKNVINEKETIVNLLNNIGSRREVELYLRHFTSVASQKFAVIKVGGAVLRDHMDALSGGLSFLQRVGLYPIVVHGASPQLVDKLNELGMKSEYHEGIRVTDAARLEVVRRVFQSENLRLVETLERLGTRARPIYGGVFTAELLDQGKYGFVGKIVDVNKSMIESCITSGALPILTPLAETLDGQILNVNADIAASMLARVLEPLKVVYVNEIGGLINQDTGERMDVIDLDSDYDDLMNQSWVRYGTRLKLVQIKELLDHLPRSSSVSIISPNHLQKELFTVSGAGTLVRRGFRVHRKHGLMEIDRDRFRSLMEDNDPDVRQGNISVARYFERLIEKQDQVVLYHDDAYQMVAALTPLSDLIPKGGPPNAQFLDRLVVTKGAELQGLTDHLWRRIRHDQTSLVWAVPKSDENLEAHFDRSQGAFNLNDVTLFWYGIDEEDLVRAMINSFVRYRTPHYNGPQAAHLTAGHRPSHSSEAVLASSSLFRR